MSCATSSALRKSGAATILRPGAEAHTPFGTPFFNLVIDPETDSRTFVKRPLDSRMWEEIRAWEKLQRIGKLPENREYAAVLQETSFADDDDNDTVVDAPTSGRAVGGGFVVGGAGYPSYFVPDVDVDDPGDPEATTDSTDGDGDNEDYDDRL